MPVFIYYRMHPVGSPELICMLMGDIRQNKTGIIQWNYLPIFCTKTFLSLKKSLEDAKVVDRLWIEKSRKTASESSPKTRITLRCVLSTLIFYHVKWELLPARAALPASPRCVVKTAGGIRCFRLTYKTIWIFLIINLIKTLRCSNSTRGWFTSLFFQLPICFSNFPTPA